MSRFSQQRFWGTASALVLGLVAYGQGHAETILSLTQTSYDANDRPVCAVVRMNLASTATDACVLGTEGAFGPDRITRTIYDRDSNAIEVKRGVGTTNEQIYATYTYTLNGQKASEADANGNISGLVYDGFDRLAYLYYPSTSVTRTTQPCSATANTWCNGIEPYTARAATGGPTPLLGATSTADYEQYGYDNSGNRTTWRRRNGQTHAFSYDGLNRQWLDDLPGTTTDVYTSYDLLNRECGKAFTDNGSIVGDCTERFDNIVTPGLYRKYDKAGRLIATRDANGRVFNYAYDQAGNRISMTYPDGVVQGYQYNVGNMLSWTGVGATTIGMTPGYDTRGRLVSITRSNNVVTTIVPDDLNRTASFSHDVVTGSDVNWSFAYNPASQITNMTPGTSVYDYIEKMTVTDSRAYDGLNRDAGIAAVSGGYDANGNVTSEGTSPGARVFTYDMDNRLLTATGGVANITLTYDPQGRLSSYQAGAGTVIQFAYDGVNLVAEYQAGNLAKRYLHGLGNDQPLLEFTGASVNATSGKFLLANYQGSIIALADSAGTVTTSDIFTYGPYGEPMDGKWTGERFRYTGQIALPDTFLYYYKARIYDPRYGRFLQTDPVGSEDDLNLYAYVKGDPVNGSDPTGQSTVSIEIGGEATPGVGIRGSVGIIFELPSLEENWATSDKWDVGVTASVGGAVGLNGSAGVQVAVQGGTIHDTTAVTTSTNVTVGPVSASRTVPLTGKEAGKSGDQVGAPVSTGGSERITGRGNAHISTVEKFNLKVGKVGVGASQSIDARGSLSVKDVVNFFGGLFKNK
ncbi:hypothetical protein MMA231_04015 (plasmid) [Asticcacaulis sp. MM231]|uniref:RHS repeat-associated core domain-containing protein n=1 Tax=Asticcacaulis sp. MM231 TaxID=3157666 RepID=UPI0032D58B82